MGLETETQEIRTVRITPVLLPIDWSTSYEANTEF